MLWNPVVQKDLDLQKYPDDNEHSSFWNEEKCEN